MICVVNTRVLTFCVREYVSGYGGVAFRGICQRPGTRRLRAGAPRRGVQGAAGVCLLCVKRDLLCAKETLLCECMLLSAAAVHGAQGTCFFFFLAAV